MRVIPLLARFDAPQIARELLARHNDFSPEEKTVSLNTMASRASLALPLLDAVTEGKLSRTDLTAFHIRQLSELKHPEVTRRLTETWGKVTFGAGEKLGEITRLEVVFNEAPLWAYSEREGRKHFQTLCASCHTLKEDGNRIGPELTGAGKNGIRYYLENIIDPNAVVGHDYQVTTITTKPGEVVSGLLESETEAAVTVRTITDRVVIAKSEIEERSRGELSMMPEGLLEPLQERERIELLKYLTSN
jgi:putative heme-binding domain-containing protein